MLKHGPWWFASFGEISTPLINWWLKAMDVTPAELALRLGFVMLAIADHSVLNIERVVEIALLRMSRMRYNYEHLAGATAVHTYTLTEEQDAEIAYWNDMPIATHTRYDISTHLERA